MKTRTALQKINEIAEKEPSKWLEEAEESIANHEWRMKSARIALRIMNEIRSENRSHKMSQKFLAEKMGVSPQYVNKILRGQENLSLGTICKIEKAMGITLVEILSYADLHKSEDSIFRKTIDLDDSDYMSEFLQVLSKKIELPKSGGLSRSSKFVWHYLNLLKQNKSENTIA